jgi:hypothetical protein
MQQPSARSSTVSLSTTSSLSFTPGPGLVAGRTVHFIGTQVVQLFGLQERRNRNSFSSASSHSSYSSESSNTASSIHSTENPLHHGLGSVNGRLVNAVGETVVQQLLNATHPINRKRLEIQQQLSLTPQEAKAISPRSVLILCDRLEELSRFVSFQFSTHV